MLMTLFKTGPSITLFKTIVGSFHVDDNFHRFVTQYNMMIVSISFIERQYSHVDSLSNELVNGDHLVVPTVRDYSYSPLGPYNQMSPSPKTATPQPPSPSYGMGEFLLLLHQY